MARPKTNQGKCSISDCKKDAVTSGMCQMHYTRIYRHKNPHTIKKINKYENEICAIGNCTKQAYAKFLCESHYDQVYRKKKKHKDL
jgi:hypothetical protein